MEKFMLYARFRTFDRIFRHWSIGETGVYLRNNAVVFSTLFFGLKNSLTRRNSKRLWKAVPSPGSPILALFTLTQSPSCASASQRDRTFEPSTSKMHRQKIIIDTDVGVDDACGLILAFSNPKLDVLALTVVFGNVSLQQAVANASRIRKLVKRENVPIYAGASGQLVTSLSDEFSSGHYHGQDGLGDTPETFPAAAESDYQAAVAGKHAAQAIIEHIHENPDCTMLCLGPLTNLALALKLDETIGDRLKHLYIMGGNTHAVGNTTGRFTAEFNFHKDPEAANIVLAEIRCPVTVVPWEAFLNFPCSKEFVKAYAENDATTKSRFVRDIMRKPLSRARDRFGLCDELATAIVIDPSIILETEKRYYAAVELHGLYTRGQVALDYKHSSGKKPNVEFVTKVDIGKAERILLESLQEPNAGSSV